MPQDNAAQALLMQRNREPGTQPPAQWNAVLETMLAHRSVRGFLPDALPDGTLELLVAAAQSASTSSNLQVWSVVAVPALPPMESEEVAVWRSAVPAELV